METQTPKPRRRKWLLILLAVCLLGLLWVLAPGKGLGRRELAFGPFLSAGWALTVLFGQGIIDWYLGLLA